MSRVALSGLFNPAGTGPINIATSHKLLQKGMAVQTTWGRSDARTGYSSAASGNGTTITDLNLTIVPKFATSMLLITWMVNGEFSGAAWDNVFVIHRGGALITTAGYEGYNFYGGNNRWSGFVAGQYDNNADSTMENYRIQYWIPAGSTASQTFAPAVRSASGTAYTFFLNRTVGSTGGDNYEVVISTGTITEIAQ
jgi:hypothetical protein